MQRSCTNPFLNDHTSDGILFVSWIRALKLCTVNIRKLYYSSFAFWCLSALNLNRGLVASQDCENRMIIDRTLSEKVEVTVHFGELT